MSLVTLALLGAGCALRPGAARHGGRLAFSAGQGRIDYDPEVGSRAHANTILWRLEGEYAPETLGLGARVEGASSTEDLTVASGVDRAKLTEVCLFAHATVQTARDTRVRVPLRLGPVVEIVDQDTPTSSPATTNATFVTLGGEAEIAPEIDLVQTDTLRLTGFASGHFGLGSTEVRADIPGVGKLDRALAVFYGFEAGVRLELGGLEAGLSLASRTTVIDSTSDGAGLVEVPSRSYGFTGVLLTIGASW